MSKTVTTLQTKLGLKPDGVVGAKTVKAIADHFKLNTLGAAHLLGQCFVETQGFSKFRENLYYVDPKRTASIFKTAFDGNGNRVIDPEEIEVATGYVKNPVRLANKVYANKMGNGNEASGDGYKYRGVGAIHLTGKDNVARFAKHIGRPELVANPDPIEVELAFEAAYFFFYVNNLFRECKDLEPATIRRVSNGVNRGNVNHKGEPLHLKERIAATKRMYELLTL